jgi:CHAD domain-containing protein
MKNALHRNIISYTKLLVQLVEGVAFQFDADNIHDIRTTYKKIRALLRWQKTGNKIYKSFKNIYDVAGKLRNIQVAKQMIRKEKESPRMFNHWLTLNLVTLKKEWEKAADNKIIERFKSDIQNLRITTIKNKKFLDKRMNAITAMLESIPITDLVIHDTRKMIKDLQYILEWWQKHRKGSKPLIMNVSIRQLKKIGKRIGEYNDKRMLLLLFTEYAHQEKDPLLMNQINLLMDKWQQEKIVQKEKLITWLHSVNAGLSGMSNEVQKKKEQNEPVRLDPVL